MGSIQSWKTSGCIRLSPLLEGFGTKTHGTLKPCRNCETGLTFNVRTKGTFFPDDDLLSLALIKSTHYVNVENRMSRTSGRTPHLQSVGKLQAGATTNFPTFHNTFAGIIVLEHCAWPTSINIRSFSTQTRWS